MDSSTTPAEDGGHQTTERTLPDRSRQEYSKAEPPTPPTSINADCDYSDVASVDSQNSRSPRRRYRRGGRRGRKGGKLQSVSEFELPKDAPSEQQVGVTDTESKEEAPLHEDYDAEELRRARSSRPSNSNTKRSPKTAKKSDTGIRAFNMTRAESSGGKRPVGITIERPKSTGKPKGKGKDKAKKKEKKKMDTTPVDEDEREDDENDGETETETRNPVSIRFDLNLEVEIFLRAKIKGEVTVTFL